MLAILLTLSTANCRTIEYVEIEKEPVEVPEAPERPEITFEVQDGNLILSPDEGRRLSVYLIEVTAYQKKLLEIIDYYEPESAEDSP